MVHAEQYLTVNGETVTGAKDVMVQPGSVLPVVKTYSSTSSDKRNLGAPAYWYSHFSQSACVTIGRVLITAVESSDKVISKDVPTVIDPKKLDTLRWRYRHTRRFSWTKSDGKAVPHRWFLLF